MSLYIYHMTMHGILLSPLGWDVPHVILDAVIKLLSNIGRNLTKNDLVACHRLVNSDRIMI